MGTQANTNPLGSRASDALVLAMATLLAKSAEAPHMTKRKVPPMPRSRSSVLAFKLREFLDTQRTNATHIVRKPFVPVTHTAQQPDAQPTQMSELPPPPRPKKEDMVWVDAFFYGFYIEKSKAAAYQSSLNNRPSHARR